MSDTQRGLSMVEVIIFIVLVGVAIAGVLGVMNTVVSRSSDPMVRKQAMAIAEAMLEEVQLMPMTYCDPDDANVLSAANGAGCASAANNETTSAPQAGETRYSPATPFDNVADYNGFDTSTAVPSGIRDIGGTAMAGLDGYRAVVSVAPAALAGAGYTVAATNALLVTVSVTGPTGESVRLQAYRTRHAPRNP
ncbi:MAG: type II secretion system protein [Burkholderiales bacterium]